MKKRIVVLMSMLMGIGIALSSCEEIFENDLSGYTVKLSSPADSIIVSDTAFQLIWNPIATQSDFQVQVAQPRFDSLTRMIKDTITRSTSIVISALERGKRYQWRVRAISNDNVGPYSKPRMFTIQKVTTDSP